MLALKLQSLKEFFAERQLKRSRHLELYAFPRRRGIQLGFKLTRDRGTCSVNVGIKYLFCAHVFWKWPEWFCSRTKAREIDVDLSLDTSSLYVKWGRDRMFADKQPHRFYYWPWKYELVAHEWVSLDLYTTKLVPNKLEALIKGNEPEEVPENWMARRYYSYVYQRSRNGPYSRQDTEATYYIERHTWRRGRIPFYRHVSTDLRISFAHDMGPGRGSYKGGIVGISWPMLKGETAHEAFQRFAESDYKFR